MEPMTTEERFTKIENAIYSLTEIQARHESAIRDLIIVSRTVLDSQKETTVQQKETTVQIQALASEMRQSREAQREAQQATDEKLHILIETVDRIIRNQKS